MAKSIELTQDHKSMRTPEELQLIHDQMKLNLMNIIGQNLKFEVCLAASREIIRTNYHSVDMTTFQALLPFAIMEDTINIMIDPSTPKKVYYQIIDNIYATKKLNISIKGSAKKRNAESNRGEALTKEQQLLLLVEVNYLNTYKNMSQVQIGDYIESNRIVGIEKFYKYEQSKDINRFVKMIKMIKRTTDKISPSDYLI